MGHGPSIERVMPQNRCIGEEQMPRLQHQACLGVETEKKLELHQQSNQSQVKNLRGIFLIANFKKYVILNTYVSRKRRAIVTKTGLPYSKNKGLS